MSISTKQARVIEIYDATPEGPGRMKAAAATVAEEFSHAVGLAGNVVRKALRDAGRGNEIREGHGGPTGKPKDAADALRAVIESNESKLARMTDEGPVDTDDDKAVFAALVARSERAVASATARLEKVRASRGDDRAALVDAERTRLVAAAKERAESGAASRADIERAIEQARTALAAIEG